MKIYVVMGVTGYYDDREEWPVVAFAKRNDAQIRVLQAKERADEICSQQHKRGVNMVNEYDPRMKMEYPGTTYYIMEVDLAE